LNVGSTQEPTKQPARTGQKGKTIMTSIDAFSTNVYSEETHPVSESEYDEVMSLMASGDFDGYSEWSAALEQAEFEREQERLGTVSTQYGAMLLKRECTHKGCTTTRCSKAQTYGGIAI
jgi:hypothetical protein